MVRNIFLALVLTMIGASTVYAQTLVRLQPARASGTLAALTDYVELSSENVGGFGSVTIQTLDSYVGIWVVQCSVTGDDADFDDDDVLILQRKNSTSTATEVEDIVGIWTVTNAAGCRKIRVQPTEGFSGTDTIVAIEATQTGGAGGGGGGGGAASTVAISQTGTDNDVDATLSFTLTEAEDGSIAAGQNVDVVGTLPYMHNGSAWVRLLGNATDGLLVNLGANNDITGTVTANLSATDNAVLDDIADGIAVTNAGTFAVQVDGSALTALQLIAGAIFADDDAFTLASSKVIVSGAIRDDELDSLTAVEGDAVALRVDSTGALHVTAGAAYDGTADGNRSLLVDAAGDVIEFATDPFISEAVADWTLIAPVPQGCRSSSGAPTAVSADDANVIWCGLNGELKIAGTIDHDNVDSGSPVGVGYRAIAHGANPTAVAAADRTVGYANRAGIPFMIGGHPNIITETVQVTDADGAQTGTAIATVSAGTKIVVTRASVKCSNANTVDTDFRLLFDTDGTPTAASESGVVGEIAAFDDIPPGGGAVEGSGSGILGVGADDEDLRYVLTDPTTGSCNISVSYYTIES